MNSQDNFDNYNKQIDNLIRRTVDEYQKINKDYSLTSTSIRENLVAFVSKNEKNIENSYKYYENIVSETKKANRNLNLLTKEKINHVTKENEKKCENNNRKIEQAHLEKKYSIKKMNETYDVFVTKENDILEKKQYDLKREIDTYINEIENDERTQISEFDDSIENLNIDIELANKKNSEDIKITKSEFIAGTSSHNDEIKNIKHVLSNYNLNMQKENQEKNNSFNGLIENNTNSFSELQKEYINEFKDQLLLCDKEIDDIALEIGNSSSIRFLDAQANNRIQRLTYEIRKNHKIKLLKIKNDLSNKQIRIDKEDTEKQTQYKIKKEEINANCRIAEVEKLIAIEAINRDHKLDIISLTHTNTSNRLASSLSIKRLESEIIREKINMLKETQIKDNILKSHLTDIISTINIENKKIEKEFSEKKANIILQEKEINVNYFNQLYAIDLENETSLISYDADVELIRNEINDVNAKFDYETFKIKTNSDIEIARIEHILRFFNNKVNQEKNVLFSDIKLLIQAFSLLKQILLLEIEKYKLDSNIKYNDLIVKIEKLKNIVIDTFKYVSFHLSGSATKFETENVESSLETYLENVKKKKEQTQEELEKAHTNIDIISDTLAQSEQDLAYLEVTKKSIEKSIIRVNNTSAPNKNDTLKSIQYDLDDIDKQINSKNASIHIQKLKLKIYNNLVTTANNRLETFKNNASIFNNNKDNPLFNVKIENYYEDSHHLLVSIINHFEKRMENIFLKGKFKKNKNLCIHFLIKNIGKTFAINYHLFDSFYRKIKNNYDKSYQNILRIHNNMIRKEQKNRENRIKKVLSEKNIVLADINNRINDVLKTISGDKNKNKWSIAILRRDHARALQKIHESISNAKIDFQTSLKSLDYNRRSSINYYDKCINDNFSDRTSRLINFDKTRIDKKRKAESIQAIAYKKLNYDLENLSIFYHEKEKKINEEFKDKMASYRHYRLELERNRLNEIKAKKVQNNLAISEFENEISTASQALNEDIKIMKKNVYKKLAIDKAKLKKQ